MGLSDSGVKKGGIMAWNDGKVGLYVHVPFCVSKCAYCDFASFAGRGADIPRYTEAVAREIYDRGESAGHPKADTVFLGGGTPSLLRPEQLKQVLDALRAAFRVDSDAEITCECNPGTLTPAFAGALRDAGGNRLSIGAQACQERLLRTLGRIHTWRQVEAAVDTARGAGIQNINLDLMLGLPRQSLEDAEETLTAALALSPTHISCYGLIIEEGTPISRGIASGALTLPDEETERGMYELARSGLAAWGYAQYEISNFAKAGYECRHNIGCWTRAPYLGFGCAAHSFYKERRMSNPAGLDAYLAGEAPKVEDISPAAARFESLMLGLRMTRGVRDADFTAMHGMSIADAVGGKLDKPVREGLLEWRDGALALTRRGMDVQNMVLTDLM
jgi:oxygen-independent coproporphyrinogen III oxidase